LKALVQRLIGGLLHRRSPGGQASCSPLMAHLDPSQLASPDSLVRLGTAYGGWIIPANPGLQPDSVCYLAGAGEDLSFDCALARRFHCRVRIIDPTPRAVEHFRQLERAVREGRRFSINGSKSEFYEIAAADFGRLSFLAHGLADQDVELKFYLPKDPAHVSCSTVNLQKTENFFTAQCHRLSTVMAQQGDRTIDLLKMDIEGAEYAVLQEIMDAGLLPRLLLVELDEAHTPLDSDAGSRIHALIRQLNQAGMRCIAVEGCNATFVRTW
jgi:FkbM family methyltransferase